jgi:peptidoglycan hydrolase-like protein with peptidoglycan-binding domain
LLVTGRDLAIAAKLRASGQSANADVVRRELVCLRAGSTGDEVKRLRAKLALPDGNYFGPAVKKALVDEQKRRNEPIDGVYSPALDTRWGWAVFS